MSWDRIGPRLFCIIPCPKQPLFSQTGPLAVQQTKGLSHVPLDYKDRLSVLTHISHSKTS